MPTSALPRLAGPCWLASVTAVLVAAPAFGQAPLHARIDQAIQAGNKDFGKIAAPPSNDAEFLRRVYLDVTGIIPSTDEARAFLADSAPDRREKLVDRLLGSEKHAYHLADTFDVLLMDRRPNKHVQ